MSLQPEGYIALYRNYQADFPRLGTLAKSTVDNALKELKTEFPELNRANLKQKKNWDLKLEKYEQALTKNHLNFKCGVLLYKKGQKQNEIFSNGMTKHFTDFLDFLGQKIELKGWSGYAGGLDTKAGSTGEYR